MQKKGIPLEFAERVFKQILGFGEYGFPESHAASFALIAYATAYLRCHHLPEFTCSLLNAQPMGFYAPATIVDDAKRHGLVIRSVDVRASRWDCTLEGPDVRMGLRYVKGLGSVQRARIENAQQQGELVSLEDFVRRTDLDAKDLSALAQAGAFECFGRSRRQALWTVRGLSRDREVPLAVALGPGRARFVPLLPIEQIAWDYGTMSHSARAHPLAVLREELRAQGLSDASELASFPDGSRVRYAGLVICRQRPGTAGGVTFMTLEDETGFANIVLWKSVFDAYALLARKSSFLGLTGKIQAQDGVVHLVAEELWLPETRRAPARSSSRDFH
jgi:error-prone DNA polymerase